MTAQKRPDALDAEAVFEALCRVQSRPDDGPAVALARFVQEITRAPADAPADEFPDFAAEPAYAEPSEPPADGPAPPTGGAKPVAVLDALLAALVSYRGLLDRANRDFDEVFAQRARGEPEGDDATIARLRDAQRLLVKYPIAGQAVFAALVREGRQYAKTREGAAWRRRLAPSPTFAQARTLFEGVARGLVTEGAAPLPSTWIDAVVQALERDLERVLEDVQGAGRDR
ncbi:MAG: hypothetical protein U0325_21400 [Polyangiales bacterium]